MDADAARFSRALKALPPDSPDGLSQAMFDTLRTARRSTFAFFGRILALDTRHPARDLALSMLSHHATGLGAYYRALRAEGTPAGQRQDRRAAASFVAASRAFAALDRELGCPFGCKP